MEYQTLDSSTECRTILMKGAPGSGKTWKAAHFPRPVYFNFDHNLSGLKKLPEEVRKNIRIIDPCVKMVEGKPVKLKGRMVWSNFSELLGKVCADPDVATIIIDSVTTLQEYLMDKILGNESPDTQMQIQHWGAVQRYWKTLAEELLCNETLDKHIIFIAHEKSVEDESSGIKMLKYELNMGGSTKSSFDLYFTDVWRCYVDIGTKGVKYMVATEPRKTFSAKCSMELPATFEWDNSKEEVLKQL